MHHSVLIDPARLATRPYQAIRQGYCAITLPY